MRLRFQALVWALIVLAAAACDPSTGQQPSPTPVAPSSPLTAPATGSVGGGSFRYGIEQPRSIVAPLAGTAADLAVVDTLFDSLTSWDVGGEAVPSAAVEWSASPDMAQWTFRLRSGAVFSDGTPVTAESFRSAWALAVTDGPFGYLLEDVVGHTALAQGQATDLSGVQAVDDLTLDVRLATPRADFAVVVGHPALGPIVPAQAVDNPDGWLQAPEGNGPFALAQPWTGESFIRAAAVTDWINGDRGEGSPSEILFRISDLDINYLAFVQGRQDLTSVPPDALALAEADFPSAGGAWNGPGLITGGRPEVYVLAVNRAVPPYDESEVREAVSLALDRELLADSLESGNLTAAISLVPPGVPGFADVDCEYCRFAPAVARLRLDRADVSTLTLAFNAGGGHESVRDQLRGVLSDSGASLVSNNRGTAPALPLYQERLAGGNVGLFRLPLVADVPSALSVLYPLLHSREVPQNGGMNYLRYDNPVIDSLLDQAARTADADNRANLLARVIDLALNDDVVVIPVLTYRHSVVVSERIDNLRYSPFGLVNFTDITVGR